jgi:hypothetical protein
LWFYLASSNPSNSIVLSVPVNEPKSAQLTNPTPVSNSKEEIVFPVRKRTELLFEEHINERVKEAKIVSLKEKRLDDKDLEFRVWVGFGKKPLEGFVISRIAGKWQGTYLESINDTIKPPFNKRLPSPKSGWEEFWKQVTEAGLMTLPDFSELKGYEADGGDGTSYVVEVKTNGVYQTYAYIQPYYQKHQEAKQMLRIAETLYTEFSIESDR